ncbi:flagellin, partial [Pseudoxanthomonas sp. CF385]|uniref:flagellin n=1 Tax=Pseudoxanthomonas sp. CF385 TaxID=1881042 RepID=UPI000880B24E
GTKLLDGSFTSQLFQVGANAGQAIAIDKVVDARSQSLGNVKFAADVTGTAIADAAADGSVAGLTINAVAIDTVSYKNGAQGEDIAKSLATAINAKMGETGVYASVTADQVTLNSVKAGKDLVVGGTVTGSGLTAATTTAAATATASFAKDLDITTFEGAQKALEIVDAALTSVNSARADLGAVQNRFTSVVANLQTSSENLAASRSRIRDTDFAKETAELTRTQILQQAGTAMLAQANQVPQNVLSLLR